MQLYQLIETLLWLQKKTPDSKKQPSDDPNMFESTEYIISYEMKKRIRSSINQTSINNSKPSELFELLRLLNEYTWKDDCLKFLYANICKLNKPLNLIECISFKTYVSTDNIHQPYYTQLKKKMLESNLMIGDYAYNKVYILYMIGEMVGSFILGVDNNVEWSYFDTDTIKDYTKTKFTYLQNQL